MSWKGKLEKMPGYNSLVLPVHFLRAAFFAAKFGWPARGLRVIAVTGTNGKTTTSFMIWKMLNEAGLKCGLLTTVGWATGADDLRAQVEHMTTERVEILDERMAAIRDAGAKFMVLETTSHALAQFRTLGVPVEIAVLTNLTQEHLDYHGTMARYRRAKGKLFRRAKVSVINADDENAEWFEKYASGEIITYGIKNGGMRATDVRLLATGVEYACGDMKIRTQIPGKFNVYNSLAAAAVGKILGLGEKEIEDGIFALKTVEGRMARIDEGQDFGVIVDYAHTPDAIMKVFESVRSVIADAPASSSKTSALASCGARSSHAKCDSLALRDAALNSSDDERRVQSVKGRIIAVHGGAGRRDHATRRPRGEILGRNADVVIITEDDSRDEDPAEIAEMFVEGAVEAGKVLGEDLFVELDRGRAIARAVGMARKGDLVLILGKGHEKTILRKDGAVEFEDEKEVRKAIRGMRR